MGVFFLGKNEVEKAGSHDHNSAKASRFEALSYPGFVMVFDGRRQESKRRGKGEEGPFTSKLEPTTIGLDEMVTSE